MNFDYYNETHRPQRFQILPPIVKNIIIINFLFFLASFVLNNKYGINIENIFGLHFPLSNKFEFYQIITYLFIHADFSHLFFNMFAFWMFGAILENYWGPKRFLLYFFITGIGAAIIYYTIVYYREIMPEVNAIDNYIASPNIDNFDKLFDIIMLPMPFSINNLEIYKEMLYDKQLIIGASGAVFGILLAFGMLFPNSLIYIYFFIPMKAKYFVILYGLIELWAGLANTPGDNIGHFAHLGGMIFGLVLILYWKYKDKRSYY